MIEKTFVDRVPTHPGRVTLTPVPGQANVYDMVRSDSPTEPGTPLNKATFDSMTQSRLTGRYYVPAVSIVQGSGEQIYTANPLPTSWTGVTTTGGNSGNYSIFSTSSVNESTTPNLAFDGTTATEWQSGTASQPHIGFYSSQEITVRQVRLSLRTQRYMSATWHIEGSKNRATWNNLLTFTAGETSDISTRALTNPGAYNYYRLRLDSSAGQQQIGVGSFEIASYSIPTKSNAFTVPNDSDGFPDVWSVGQIVLIETPASTNTVGVSGNTLNGITVNTILQPGKRYELRYTGSAFVVKEV